MAPTAEMPAVDSSGTRAPPTSSTSGPGHVAHSSPTRRAPMGSSAGSAPAAMPSPSHVVA